MGMFDNPDSKSTVSPQMVESLKIRHWEIVNDNNQPALQIIALVALQGGLTAAGVEVGFFLNHQLLGSALCDEWGQAIFKGKLPNNQSNDMTLSIRIKGTVLDDTIQASLVRHILYENGTVLDNQTGLMWMRCALGQQWDTQWNGKTCIGEPTLMTWEQACNYGNYAFAGYHDWRLPSVRELDSLMDINQKDIAIDPKVFPIPHRFEHAPSYIFWSNDRDHSKLDWGEMIG